MKFQDKLSQSACNGEQVQSEEDRRLEIELSPIVADTLADIQNDLTEKAGRADYSFENEKKFVECITPLPKEIQNYLCMNIEKIETPRRLNSLTLSMIGKSQKEVRKIIKDYKKTHGEVLDFSDKPGNERHINYFRIYEDKEKKYKKYITMLKYAAKQEGILCEIKLMRDNCIDKATFYDLPVTINGFENYWNYSLVWKSECEIIEHIENENDGWITIDLSETKNDIFSKIDSMEGHQFEFFCADILTKNGFDNVEVTSGSGDQGIDVIADKDGIKYGIQCKCYSSDIGNKAVQEAFSGKSFYNCHIGVVLTNRYFTRSAIELAQKNGIILWDRNKLLELLENN